MAESVTIARPYAQAVFRLAREAGTLPVWSERLERLAALAHDPELAAVLDNPKFSAAEIGEFLMSLTGESGNAELASFVGLLAANERLAVLAHIHELFEELKSADAGVKEALVTSAFALDDAQLQALMVELEAHFGSRLSPRVEVDPALIGGITVTVGDQVLDASVRGKLGAMACALKN